MFNVTDAWKKAFPGAVVGVLAMQHVSNPEQHAGLEQHKEELQAALRARYAGASRETLAAIPALRAYAAYLKPFKKTYHVAMQLESVVLKGKSIPSVAALVEAMFMAELEGQLLTAGHDLDSIVAPVTLDVSTGNEQYELMRGQPQQLKAGDMMISDAQGVISCIVYGPDRRTQITSATQRVLFTVYAPAGIGEQAVSEHLRHIQANVQLVAPAAETLLLQAVGAAG
jgi:DNA/RNA-binding domain of Phe-tRNA-synthetase-like protein